MSNNLFIAEKKLMLAKKRLEELWNIRKTTDKDVLEAADEVDKLLNLYNRLRKAQE